MKFLKHPRNLFVATLVVTILAAVSAVSVIYAQTQYGDCIPPNVYGRVQCQGYFTGQYPLNYYTGNNTILLPSPALTGISDAASFINVYNTHLNSASAKSQTAAAFTIDVMLGMDGPDFGNNKAAGITYAKNNFSRWANLVNYYQSKGLIDWNRSIYVDYDYINSSLNPSVVDVYMGTDWEDATVVTIRFRNPDGSTAFVLDKWCGNVRGNGRTTANPGNYTYTPGMVNDASNPPPLPSNGASTSSTSSVVPGQTVKFDLTVKNNGPDPGSPAKLQGKVYALDPNSGMPFYYSDTNCGGSCYNTPANSKAPQSGITSVFNSANTNNVPALNNGQTFTAPPDSATSSPRSMSFVIPSNAPIGRKYCFYASVTPSSNSGGTANTNFGASCFIVKAPISGACESATTNPASPLDPSTPYTVTVSVRYPSNADAAAALSSGNKMFVKIGGPGLAKVVDNLTPTQSGALLTVTTPQQPATNQTGRYSLGYGVTGTVGAVSCGTASATELNPPYFNVASKPYFSVNYGDISAGAGMSVAGNECTAGGTPQNDKAGVVGWNRGAAYGYAGSGADYGVLALGHIQDFASGQGSALAPTGESFGNTGGDAQQVNIGQGLYGGEFGGTGCTGDYFKDVAAAKIQASQTLAATAVPNCTGSNDALCHRVIYVSGDVYINGNITFSGSYANTSQIPSFSLVVRGNIYIAPGVTRLDGFYVAQPTNGTSTDGVIYTCATAPSIAAALDTTLASTCGMALTVNGAVVARQVWLLRTAGSITSTPAETFNYLPEAWLSAPFGNGLSPVKSDEYDSITGLPPVL